ncbi:MAG: anthranilate synthase component I [Elusimicrobiota bacterium]
MKNKKKISVISKKIVADFLTPVSAYNSFRDDRYSFLLESVEKGKAGRYSFIGLSPRSVYEIYYDRIRVLERTGTGFEPGGEIKTSDPLSEIYTIMEGYEISETSDLPPLCGGFVGYLSYEIIASWEKLKFENPSDLGLPLGVFIFTDELIAFDHLYNTADIIKLAIDDGDETDDVYSMAGKSIEAIIDKLSRTPEPVRLFSLERGKRLEFDSNFSEDEFNERVRKIKEEIVKGEIIQGVFSQRLTAVSRADSFNYYRALRIINPSPYMFYLKLDNIVLCGSSPEVLVKVTGDEAVVRPIAGTRPRGKTEEEEKSLAEDLKSDIKERAEHIMLVDLGRNDLGKVCRYGTVKVKNLMSIEKYSHVIHMVTDVAGTLREDVNCIDVLKACFPAGTVSGAPKIRAIEIIEKNENIRRGPYAGAVGYFSFTGDMDMCITIRTMLVYEGHVYVQAGAGIVADSVPEREYQETLNKARALLEAVQLGERIDDKEKIND